jgi:hypothetical protein
VELGAARNTRSSPVRSLVAIHSEAESGVMSGVMRPAPPASRRASAKRSTPYWSTGFQYVITSTGASTRERTPSTAANTSRTRKPADRAACVAFWIASPSITGSEYGSPSSSASTPFSTSATAASMLVARSGKPTGR